MRKIILLAALGAILGSGCQRDLGKSEQMSTQESAALPGITRGGSARIERPVGTAGAGASDATAIDRGRYLVAAIGCGDCHTPKVMGPHGPQPDTTRLLAGHPEQGNLPPVPPASGPWNVVAAWDLTAWSGPWGTSYTINLTPDEGTGIGSWSEDTFVKAIKTGRHMGTSRPILPPMPWEAFRNLTGGSQGHLCLSADDPASQESNPGTASALRSRDDAVTRM